MIKGIDISKWQGDMNFDKLKGLVDFVIIKATEGNGYTDTKFKRNQSEARRVGLPLGYYHFARPDLNNSAESEANYFLKTLGEIRNGEVLCLDYEPTWGGDAVTWCYQWLNTVLANTGVRPLIYLNQSLAKKDWTRVINENFGLWLAVYDYDPNKAPPKTGWPSTAIKQYSNKLPLMGLEVDGNVFYGDVATFRKYGFQSSQTDNDMTDDQRRSLEALEKFKKETTDPVFGNLEGATNAAIGAFRDLPGKDKQIQVLQERVLVLESDQKKLADRITALESNIAADLKLISDWQAKVETANKKLETQNKTIEDLTTEKNAIKGRYEAKCEELRKLDKMTAWGHIRYGINLLVKKQK